MLLDMERFLAVAIEKKFFHLDNLLSEDIEYHSPARSVPILGKAEVKKALTTALSLIKEMRYHRIFSNDSEYACEFSGRVDGKPLKGIDLITLDEAGKFTRLEVMIRPHSALIALREAHIKAGHT